MNDDVLERARKTARRQGTSVQEIVREHPANYLSDRPRDEIAKELVED